MKPEGVRFVVKKITPKLPEITHPHLQRLKKPTDSTPPEEKLDISTPELDSLSRLHHGVLIRH